MKILQISINNLASLEGETTLDFTSEPLASAGIFAITGPTGAGKSTILDALCLALYARTPRYVQAKSKGIELQDISGETIAQGDPRAILRDGTAFGSASVCFVGMDQDKYEATWAVKRARLKVTGRLMAHTHTLYNQSKKKEIAGNNTQIKEEIERLIGLNFDQFTRSVLLAQGDFTAFMKADKEEKSALLEKLTGSQIYSEISKIIYDHFKNESDILNNMRARAENVDLLTEAQITQLSTEMAALQQQVKEQTQEKNLIDQAVNWHRVNADLENKYREAADGLSQAETIQEGLSVTKNQLELVQKLRPLKSVQESLLTEKEVFQKETTSKTSLDLQIQQLTDKMQQAEQFYKDLLSNKTNQENAIRAARPLLAQASNLDTQINISTDQLKAQNSDLKEIRQNKELIEKEKEAVQEKLSDNQSRLTAVKTWLDQRQDRRKIAESTEMIISRLTEATGFLQKSKDSQKIIEELNIDLEAHKKEIVHIQGQLDHAGLMHQEKLQSLERVQKLIANTDSRQLDEEITALQNKQRTLETAQSYFERYEKAATDFEVSVQQLAENTQKIESLKEEAAQISPSIKTLETQIDTTRSLIEKATLRNTENIEKLRASLRDNDPCPVCGSVHHPYADGAHADLADQLLSTLHEDLIGKERAYREADRQHNLVISEIELRQNQQQRLTDTYNNRQLVFQEIKKIWESTTFYPSLKNQSGPSTKAWFEQQITTTQGDLAVQQQNKTEHQTQLQQRDQLQTSIETERNSLQKLKDEHKDHNAAIDLISHKLSTQQAIELEAAQNLQQLQKDLKAYFPTPDWFSNWQATPDSFTSALQKFALDWKQKQNEAEDLNSQIDRFKIELTGLDRTFQQAVNQLNQQQEAVNKHQLALDGLRKDRMTIFDGKSVSAIENDLEQTLLNINQQADKAHKEAETLQKDWNSLKQQQAIAENTLKQVKQRCEQLEQKIIRWIETYNQEHHVNGQLPLDRVQVDHLLSYSEQWVHQQQEKIEQADQKVLTAKSKLEERLRDLQKHLETTSDQRELEALLALQDTLTHQLEEKQKAVLDRQLRIENNQKNIKKLGQLQKQIEQQLQVFEGWAALNGLIGSRDGRKFREIAQQYTLDLLLGYANKHLYVLSKRYVLSRIPDSLAIQVIDQDMAGELRSVYSLSGGESFLVSLALALGLASLSSQRLKVESLFIDEGFGSLDPTTLCVAMDALERLQDQGRKVGVISHVQEMTERIAVQIQVNKKASGKSNISVASLA